MMKKNYTISSIVNIEVFGIVLLGGFLITWLEPKIGVSEFEKRPLTPFPTFNFEKLLEGHYTDSLDLYYADHFAHREQWVEFTASIKGQFGFRENDLMVYQTENPSLVGLDSLRLPNKDSMSTGPIIKKDPTGQPPQMKNSILIYNGMAFQLFGRQREAEINFAATISNYKTTLGDSVRVFACVVPGPIDFYLPEEYKSKSNHEKPSIDFIYSQLADNVIEVDAYGLLEASTNDFIYFKTDHHWTARGAHKAYQAFCSQAGFEPARLSAFQRFSRKKFLGSLYYATLDTRLKSSGDSLEYFMLPIPTQAWRYPDRNLVKRVATEVVSRRLGQGGSYLAFLGGDYPLIHITTNNRNGRKIMMVKDSYGNAFAPFLAMHYEEIFVVDYRSFDSNIVGFVKQNGITDLLFLHNVAIANTKFTASRESYLMRIGDLKPKVFRDTVRVGD